jgi:hypothetical protein
MPTEQALRICKRDLTYINIHVPGKVAQKRINRHNTHHNTHIRIHTSEYTVEYTLPYQNTGQRYQKVTAKIHDNFGGYSEKLH